MSASRSVGGQWRMIMEATRFKETQGAAALGRRFAAARTLFAGRGCWVGGRVGEVLVRGDLEKGRKM